MKSILNLPPLHLKSREFKQVELKKQDCMETQPVRQRKLTVNNDMNNTISNDNDESRQWYR